MHIWLVGLVALLAPMPPVASELPLALQIPAFLKALDFDRRLTIGGSSLVISVVYDPNDRASVKIKDRLLAIQGQLTRLRVQGKPVVLEELAYAPGRPVLATGVLLMTALDEAAIDALAAR